MTFISTLLKAAAALFMLVILMLLVQLDLTAFQTVEVLAPGWGWLAFVSLLALEAGTVLWLPHSVPHPFSPQASPEALPPEASTEGQPGYPAFPHSTGVAGSAFRVARDRMCCRG